MKTVIAAAALAVGLIGITATSADAYPHHPHWHTGWHHRHCVGWGWHHHARFCRGWRW